MSATRVRKPADEVPATLSDNDIYERMVSAILDHQLPPGTKLVEDRLAAAFGVSRTRIRPVLVRLANEKVVTLTPNRGAAIAEPSEAEARDVFEVRRMIEPLLVERFIALATAVHIQSLKHCIRDEEAARKAGDMRRAIRLSGDFHLQIAEHAGHQTLGGIRLGRWLLSDQRLLWRHCRRPVQRFWWLGLICCCPVRLFPQKRNLSGITGRSKSHQYFSVSFDRRGDIYRFDDCLPQTGRKSLWSADHLQRSAFDQSDPVARSVGSGCRQSHLVADTARLTAG